MEWKPIGLLNIWIQRESRYSALHVASCGERSGPTGEVQPTNLTAATAHLHDIFTFGDPDRPDCGMPASIL